jgi:ribose/xylose/arabinose/galactoside ABC-type transport system permease subunit
MKRFLITLALMCVLSGSALAGHIDTCGAPAPTGAAQTTSPGDVPSVGSTSPGEIPTCGWAVVLTLLDIAF